MAAAFAGGAVISATKEVVRAASDAQQSIGATEAVFGKYADGVVKASQKASKSVGLSANDYRELSNVMGAMLKNSGMPLSKLGKQSDDLVKIGADLAATYGGTTKDAVSALSSLMRGEADPIERYGVSIKQSDVNARLAAKGQDKLTGSAKKQAEQMARLELLNKQTASAQGQFGRESGTLAGQQQRLSAQVENLKASLGTALLPVLTKTLGYVNENGPKLVAALKSGVETVKGFFSSFSAGSGEASAKFGQVLTTVSTVWASLKSIFASGVTIVTALWARFGGILSTYVLTSLTNVMNYVRGVFTVIKGIFQVFSGVLTGDWSRAWTGVKNIVSGAFKMIRAIISQYINVIKTVVRAGLSVVRSIVSTAFSAIRSIFSSAWGAAKSLTSSAWSSIKGAVSRGVSSMMGVVKGIPGKIKGAFSGAGSLLKGIGGHIVDGLTAGIRGAAGRVMDAVNAIVGKIPKVIRKKMGIASPSKVTTRLGVFIGQGLEKGLTKATPGILKAVRRQGVNTKKEYAKQAKDLAKGLYNNAKVRYASLVNQSKEYAATVKEQARQYASISSIALGENENLTTDTIKKFLTDRLANIKNFTTKLAGLAKNGLSKDLYAQIVAMGPETGTAYVEALSQAGPEAIKELNGLQSQVNSAAASLGTQTSKDMYKAGIDAAKGFMNGMKSLYTQIAKSAGSLGKSMVKALKKALGIKSPSRVMKGLGVFAVKGLDMGLDDRIIKKKGERLATALQRGFASPSLAATARPVTASGSAGTAQQVTIEVRVDNSMTPEQMGAAYHKAIKAAGKAGLIRN